MSLSRNTTNTIYNTDIAAIIAKVHKTRSSFIILKINPSSLQEHIFFLYDAPLLTKTCYKTSKFAISMTTQIQDFQTLSQ